MTKIFCDKCNVFTFRRCKRCNGKRIIYIKPPLPKKICALDIETYKTDFSYRRNSKIAIIGLKFFELKNGRYNSKGYVSFTENKIKDFKNVISKYKGLVLGFNIYKFDLEVIEGYLSENFILKLKKKTVDLFFLIRFLNKGYFKGLNLDSLCEQNLGVGKSLKIKSGQIPKMWNSGRKREVIKYNQKDCDLTFKLWLKVVTQGFLKITDFHPYDGELHKTIQLDMGGLHYLTNEKLINKFYWLIIDKLADFDVHKDIGGTWLENTRLLP